MIHCKDDMGGGALSSHRILYRVFCFFFTEFCYFVVEMRQNKKRNAKEKGRKVASPDAIGSTLFPRSTEFYRVLPSFPGFYRVFTGFCFFSTGPYCVSPSITGFDWTRIRVDRRSSLRWLLCSIRDDIVFHVFTDFDLIWPSLVRPERFNSTWSMPSECFLFDRLFFHRPFTWIESILDHFFSKVSPNCIWFYRVFPSFHLIVFGFT